MRDKYKEFYENLKDGRCNGCEKAECVTASGGYMFLGCYQEPYHGKPVTEIVICPKQLEKDKEKRTMPVTKEIARKCQEYDKAQMTADRLFEELHDFFTSYDDENENVTLTGFGTCPSDQVKGDEQQFNGEYCDQYDNVDDSYHGTYYIPVEGSNEFVYFNYTC